MTSQSPILNTSDEWNRQYDFLVLDPDGWDRKNYDESWYEPITLDEFRDRVSRSTVLLRSPKSRELFDE